MEVLLPSPGKYVVAVSGGVDSVTLLHLLAQKVNRAQRANDLEAELPTTQVIVAHFDHGIREYSRDDRLFVQQLAKRYELPFVFDEGRLGPGSSEATARSARYKFLEKVRMSSGARAIITAHHEDDVLETAILNLLRGTGRKGLTSLGSGNHLYRPLLGSAKQDLISYAQDQGLTWHEDSTNSNQAYRRNYVRHAVLPRFNAAQRDQLRQIILRQRDVNRELDAAIINLLHAQPQKGVLERSWFIQLPHALAKEVLAVWLRVNGLGEFDRKTLERLTIAAKVSPANRVIDVIKGSILKVTKKNLALQGAER